MTGETSPSNRIIGVSAAVLAAAVAATLLGVATPVVALLTGCGFVLFAAPGVFVVRTALGREAGWLSPLVFGPVVGFATSSLALLLLWWAGGRGIWLVAVAPLLSAIVIRPARMLDGRLSFVRLDRRDLAPLLLTLLLVPLIVGWPFSRVGETMQDGKAYRAYFTADYVWRMVVVAELAKGDMPPQNPFYKDDALHYYWLPHLLAAVEYRNEGHVADLDALLLCQSVWMDLVFVAFLFGFSRQFVRSRRAAVLGVATAVMFTSFEGLYILWDLWRKSAPLGFVRYVNVDAVNRWLLYGMPIDGLQRLLWYQPHHACGYALGLLALLVTARRSARRDVGVMIAAAMLLGLALLISTFGALMLTSAVALYEIAGAIRHRDWKRLVIHGAAGLLPMGVAFAIVRALGYADTSGGSLVAIGINPAATSNALVSIGVSVGPILLAGAGGAVLAVRQRSAAFVPIATLVAIVIVYYFFVDVLDHQGVYVGWRCGHLMFIALAPCVGLAIDTLAGMRLAPRLAWASALVLLALAAAPTMAIDFFNTQDVENRELGPAFRWTLMLSQEEQALLRWLRLRTPPDTVVQVDPSARDSDTWAYIPAFAERRMSVGLPISMIPRQKYVIGTDRMHRLFSAEDVRDAYTIAVRNGIDYLVVGKPEREANPGCDDRFSSAPRLFTREYHGKQVSLYKVNR
jgi:hypothetical protein